MKELSLDELINRCRARDDDAFAELLSRYAPMINREVSAFSDCTLSVDELFSEASIALHKAVLRYDTEQSGVTFGLYARICVHNRLIDTVRASERQPVCEEYSDEVADGVDSPEAVLLLRDTVARLIDTARESLSEYEYRVLILYMQGYKTAEIAKRLGKTSKSVDNAKSRIFTRLRRTLGGTEL